MMTLRTLVSWRGTSAFIGALVVLFFGVSFTRPVAAQTAQITVSPLTFELTANPGEVIHNIVKVYNNSADPVQVAMEVQDFAPSGERGEVSLAKQDSQTFSIAQWVTTNPQTFSLPANSFQPVELTIAVPLGAEPGGHYGAVLASVGGQVGGSGAALTQKIGSLLLLELAGDVDERLIIKELSAPSFQEYGPITIAARFENQGTVHVKPRGFVTVTNMFGSEVAKLDLEQKNVLPRSIRLVETTLDGKWRFGKYVATLTAIYGASNEPLSYTTTFWIVPWKVTLGVTIGALILLIALFRARRRIALAFGILFFGDRRQGR